MSSRLEEKRRTAEKRKDRIIAEVERWCKDTVAVMHTGGIKQGTE
jgi:hypothetical protein